MCTVSMIMKDWMNPGSPNHIPLPRWNEPLNPHVVPYVPPFVPKIDQIIPTVPVVTPDLAKQMLDILKRVDELDKKLGRINCLLEEQEKEGYIKTLKKIARKKPKKAKRAKKVTKPVLLTETSGYNGDNSGGTNY
jgi:hypothetical protein